jgi:hypothetical protein
MWRASYPPQFCQALDALLPQSKRGSQTCNRGCRCCKSKVPEVLAAAMLIAVNAAHAFDLGVALQLQQFVPMLL